MSVSLAQEGKRGSDAKSIDELAHMSVMLAAFCDALDTLYDTASADFGPAPDLATSRARNAMPPLIGAVIEKAHELSDEIAFTSLAILKAQLGAGNDKR